MALAITTDLQDLTLSDNENLWTGTDVRDTFNYVQGSASVGKYVRDGKRVSVYIDGPWDMSDPDTHLFLWMATDIAEFLKPKNTGGSTPSGVTVRLFSSGGSWIEWHLTGSDVWDGSWRCFVLDTRNTSEIYRSRRLSSFDWSYVSQVRFYIDARAPGSFDQNYANFWFDACRYGKGIIYVSGSSTTGNLMEEIAAVADSTANKWGILEKKDDLYICRGKLVFNTSDLHMTDDMLIFDDLSAGGFISDTHYSIEFRNPRVFIEGSCIRGGVNHPVSISFPSSSDVEVRSSLFSYLKDTQFYAGQKIEGVSFNNCGEIYANNSHMNNCIFRNYQGSQNKAALRINLNTQVTNPIFRDNLRAVHIDTPGEYDFENWRFDGNIIDVLNSSPSTVIIDSSNSNVSTHLEINGGTTLFQKLNNLIIVNVAEGSEVRIFEAATKNDLAGVEQVGPVPIGLQNVVVEPDPDNPGKYRVIYRHNYLSDLDINISVINYDYQSLYLNHTLKNEDKVIFLNQERDRQYFNP